MGKSYQSTYRLEIVRSKGCLSNQSWDTKHCGRPTDDNLAKVVKSLNDSFQPGGVNAHLAGCFVYEAQVVHQDSARVKATYKAPLFEVVNEGDFIKECDTLVIG